MKRIAITVGDPSGVGPEVIRGWAFANRQKLSQAVFVGHENFLKTLPAGAETVRVGPPEYEAVLGKPDPDGARVAFAAFNINFGGVAGFIRPVIMPMAQAAVERDGNKIDEKHLEELKATSAGIDNVAWFFGQVLFVGGSGGLLVQATLAGLGYDVSLVDLAAVQIPVAVLAMLVAIIYYNLIDRRLMRRRSRVIKATGSSVYEEAPAAEKDAAEKGGEDA